MSPSAARLWRFEALDTWFFRESRPHGSVGAAELASLFPTTTILEERILPCGNLTTYALGRLFLSPWKFLRDAAARTPHAASGAPAVVQPPSALTKLPWLFRRFRITCLVLRKEPA